MEFIRGPSLRELIRTRQWSARDTQVILGQIAHALQAAHHKEIVHRDLKPENVMLVERQDGAWQCKVLDFGFAKLPELERPLGLEPLTRKGYCFGTPQYMAPEQIRGKPMDGGVDLYALGVITYEMLSGARPFDGTDAREILLSVLRQPAPAISNVHESMAPH